MKKSNVNVQSSGLNKEIVNSLDLSKKICIAVPTTGNLRIEWVMSRFGCVIPCNWSNGDIFMYFDQVSPIGYAVADARNICVEYSISNGFEWTFFIDHDTCIPADTFIRLNKYMREMKYPVVSGLYYCKSSNPEPLIFRGRGNGYFADWKFGDEVMVDGIPMGCALIHNSILKVMHEQSEIYTANSTNGPVVVRRVFETPRSAWFDPVLGKYNSMGGTEDLPWCERIIKENILAQAGWKDIAKEKYPFLMDTNIFCQHIDQNGIKYPGLHYRSYEQYKGSKLETFENKNRGIVNVARTQGSQF